MKLLLAVLLALSLWPLAAPAAGFDHAGLAQAALERHIRPGYAGLRQAAKGFQAAADSYCGTAPGAERTGLERAFAELVLAWSRIEHIRFGPVIKEQRHARLIYWPDRKGLGRKQIARAVRRRDPSVLQAGTLAAKSVAVQGLGAAEYLLYGPGNGVIATAGTGRDFRCGYLRAIAANLAGISAELEAAWADGGAYAEIFLHPGPDNPAYLKPAEVSQEIAKSLIVGLQAVRDVRIAGPLGMRRTSARKTRAAYRSSGLSTRAIAANLEGLIALYENGGVAKRIGAHEAGMDAAIRADLELALTELEAVTLPMKQAVEDSEQESRLMASGFPLKNAREQIARVLADAAGLALGFNALDGD